MHPYLVIQEVQNLEPVLLDQCALVPEVATENGERTPLLIGGRDDANFVLAIRTSDSAWPTIPSNELHDQGHSGRRARLAEHGRRDPETHRPKLFGHG